MSQHVTRTDAIKNALMAAPIDLQGGRISAELGAELTEHIEDELVGYASTAELVLEARLISTVEELDRLPVGPDAATHRRYLERLFPGAVVDLSDQRQWAT